jgi:hypothetical protein
LVNVKNIINSHGLNVKYDYHTAARVRLILVGDKTYGTSFNISEVEAYLRKLTLEEDDYNIVEFVLDSPSYSAFTKIHEAQGTSKVEYLVEDPEREFKEYISSVRAEDIKKQNLDPSLLAKIFASVLSTGGIIPEDS